MPAALEPHITAIIRVIEQLVAELKSTHPFTAYLLTVARLSLEQGADASFAAKSVPSLIEANGANSRPEKAED